jgi:hypothetical protein
VPYTPYHPRPSGAESTVLYERQSGTRCIVRGTIHPVAVIVLAIRLRAGASGRPNTLASVPAEQTCSTVLTMHRHRDDVSVATSAYSVEGQLALDHLTCGATGSIGT